MPLNFEQSGFLVPGDARALTDVVINGSLYWVATQNRKGLTFFQKQKNAEQRFTLKPNESSAHFTYSDGRKQKIEFTEGSSFLSQKSHTYRIPIGTKTVEIKDSKGVTTRTINTVNNP